MKEIAPGIFLESAFPPYNLVLIKSQNSVVVVDIPPRPVDAIKWLEQVNSIVDRIDFVVLTDASIERQIAAMLWDIPVIASDTFYQAMAVYDDERARRDVVQRFLNLYPGANQFIDQLYPRRPKVAFSHRFQLHNRIPPIQFEKVDGAAPGSLCIVLADLGLLISGDTVCVDDVPPFANNVDSKAWLSTLATLSRKHSIKKIITGRGLAPIPRGEIERQREFLRVMRRAARKLARGSEVSSAVTEIAQDMGQRFYNCSGQEVAKEIRKGLEKLVIEIREEHKVIEEDT